MFDVFIDVLEKDLRRESGGTFIFEEISQDYESEMIEIFNIAIRDEIESSIMYKIMAEQLVGPGVNSIKKELEEHSKDEFEHFNKLITYASNHGLLNKLKYEIRQEFVNSESLPTTKDAIVQFTQDLERDAAKLYKNSAERADDEGDTETRIFFEELMKEELGHFDDISSLDKSQYGRRLNEI